MSELATSVLMSAVILVALALFVPCMESVAGLLRRSAQRRKAGTAEQQPERSAPQKIA